MFNPPFWILIAVMAGMALVAVRLRGFSFIDSQVVIASLAVALFFDMVFCKWLQYYAYVVTTPLKAFYSLIFCVIGYPAIGLVFIKFLPTTRKGVALSIAIWSAVLTLTEIFIAKPYGIVIYNQWNILPDSPIIYVISLTWEYGYFKVLQRRWKGMKS
jgi:hypothetical protein